MVAVFGLGACAVWAIMFVYEGLRLWGVDIPATPSFAPMIAYGCCFFYALSETLEEMNS